MGNAIREKAAAGIVWQLLERFGAKGVSLVVTIVLARLLDPEVYGLVAMATVLTSFLEPLIDSGMNKRLIQKKNVDDVDFSSFFYFNILMSISIYLVVFICAPFVAGFYNNQDLTAVIRVIGLNVLVFGVKAVQKAYVSRNMLFRLFFYATSIGTVLSACAGIILAYKGYGVWALVLQNLINNSVDTVVLWIVVRWRPKAVFSFNKLKDLLSFGWKFLVISLTNTIVDKIRALIIGKVYSAKDLGYYDKGNLFPDTLTSSIEAAINAVILPSLSKTQDNKSSLKQMLRRSIRISMYVLSPINFGLMACAEPLVSIILTDKWLPCLPFMYIFCIRNNFTAINVLNQNVYTATGRSGLYLKIDMIKKVINITLLIICMYFGGIIGIAISILLSTLAYIIVNTIQIKKDLDYGLFQQLKDIVQSSSLAVIMAVVVFVFRFLNLSNWLTVTIQIIVGFTFYVSVSAFLKIDEFEYIVDIFKSLFLSKKLIQRKRK
ncbi:MAG: lipopolysaccharide biosynthesis protein [Saccharofermentans sp.]|nr:lipopolysaccharide biosynthesis protein [Saccharofermentans sp.]